MKLNLQRDLIIQCKGFDQDSNESDPLHWVKIPSSPLDGFHYSLIKGSSSHFICYQNGDLIPSDFRRSRTGFWIDNVGHISSMKVSIDGHRAADTFRKYVRGLGYIYRGYGEVERLDYISYEEDALDILFVSDSRHSAAVSMEIAHSEAWPGESRGKQFALKEEGNGFWVSSTGGQTFFSVSSDGKVRKELNNGNLTIYVDRFSYFNIVASGRLPKHDVDLEKTISFHKSILGHTVLSTPDRKFNKLFLWAKHDLLEFFNSSPTGEGWFAGFPVFSWYFGRDGLWMGLAANMCGLGNLTRKHMETLLRYAENGRIPHEIGLSQAGNQDYVISDHNLDTRFMSIDSNLLWIMDNSSLRWWGYTPFPSEVTESVFRFSRSCDADGDLLLENNFKRGLIGWPETWAADRDGKCVDINALWLQVVKLVGEDISGVSYQHLKEIYLRTFFRDDGFVDSIEGQKTRIIKSAMQLIAPIFLRDGEVEQKLVEMSDLNTLTDWGVRSVSSDDPKFDGGYHTGTVWPLMTGWYVLAAYNNGLNEYAFRMLQTFVANAYDSADPGRINETYDSCQPSPTGQFAQGWSSSMYILSVLGGMLGLMNPETEDLGKAIRPSLPDKWNSLSIKRLPWRGNYYDIAVSVSGISVTISERHGMMESELNP